MDLVNGPYEIYIRSSARLLQLLHRIDDQTLGVLNLFHDQAHVHCRVLRLPLASTVETMLANKGERICQDVQRRGEGAADRPHLEFVALLGFTIVIEQS